MNEGFATVNGIKLHYREAGTGPLLLLLHGWPDFSYGWRGQIPELAKHYHVVAPDLRGFGLSDKPLRVEDQRIYNQVEDIAQLIQSFGTEKAIVIGNDWGGHIAWILAATRPELVQKLIALNAPYPSEMSNAFKSGNVRQFLRSYYIFFFQIPWLPEWIIQSNLKTFFTFIFTKLAPNAPEAHSPEVLAKYIEVYSKPGAVTSSINLYRGSIRHLGDIASLNGIRISLPVLMLWGEKDIALGKELALNSAKHCDTLTTIFEPMGGHFLHIDRPEWITSNILTFLAA